MLLNKHGGIMKIRILLLLIFLIISFAGIKDSGGVLKPEQAVYDVNYYELNLTINPATQSISGNVIIKVTSQASFSKLVLDLHNNYTVSTIKSTFNNKNGVTSTFIHNNGILTINLGENVFPGSEIMVQVFYSGKPREATMPPWDYGFVWKKTMDNKTWAGVANEEEGGDMWFPCKDHPSDEADSVRMNYTVPSDLVCIGNGIEKGSTVVDQNWKTYHWFMNNPVNNYNITFYLAPYKKLTLDYTSVTGEKFPFIMWVLPEKYNEALTHCVSFMDHMRLLEEKCGPYAFRGNKYGVVHAPYYGMEHSTAIAYGASFRNNSYGFDYLHFHELAHEWWGNLVTCADWKDCWIHEGFGTYMEALMAEKIGGNTAYIKYMKEIFASVPNTKSTYVAYKTTKTAEEIFANSTAIYYKGALVLHGLRYLMGDDNFFKFLKKCAYKDESKININDGSQCRFSSSEEIIAIANEVAGKDLTWYFNIALYGGKIPVLQKVITAYKVTLEWITENGMEYNFPVEITRNGIAERIEFSGNKAEITMAGNDIIYLDPDRRAFRDSAIPTDINEINQIPVKFEVTAFPNPFNPDINIEYSVPAISDISVSIINVLGEEIMAREYAGQLPGIYKTNFDFSGKPSGIYFARIKTVNSDNVQTKTVKLILQK